MTVSPKDPKRAAPHLAYELGMLRTTFRAIRKDEPIPIILLEAFLLHTRNLLEFFYDGGPTGAILPKDFGLPANRDKDARVAGLRADISQLVSHLTWQRVTVHELRSQEWSYHRLETIFEAVHAKAKAFFAGLSTIEQGWFSAGEFPDEFKNWI